MEIFLKFNSHNNFCVVSEKYNTQDKSIDIARNVLWLINNAEASIQESYSEGAPRRIEMEKLCDELRKQLMSQLSQKEIEELKINVYPLIISLK